LLKGFHVVDPVPCGLFRRQFDLVGGAGRWVLRHRSCADDGRCLDSAEPTSRSLRVRQGVLMKCRGLVGLVLRKHAPFFLLAVSLLALD
jgi:hypothetical protein